VDELITFGAIVLVVAGGILLALIASKVSERVPIPEPALFLVLAAVASDLFPELSERLTILEVERIAVVALIVILFNGGTLVGWRRFRVAAIPIFTTGILGTFATAGIIAVAAHYLFDFEWVTAGILGAAIAPTDPAVMFSVLGGKEIRGRAGTILEGESGVNDPAGIALMIGMVELATEDGSFWVVVEEFSIEMSVGLLIGLLGAAAMRPLLRISLPNPGLYPIRTLAAAGVIYGVASVAHGSGFLAVFVAGVLLGDADVPLRDEIERFHTALASLAEVVVFVALGITIDITDVLSSTRFLEGLALAVILALVARPLAIAPLLAVVQMRPNERLFIIWSGLRGAVPILLAAFAVLGGVDDADRVYEIVFVVVAFSVIVQGSTIPLVARRLGIRMRAAPRVVPPRAVPGEGAST
jgi:cell volume regulation protein A